MSPTFLIQTGSDLAFFDLEPHCTILVLWFCSFNLHHCGPHPHLFAPDVIVWQWMFLCPDWTITLSELVLQSEELWGTVPQTYPLYMCWGSCQNFQKCILQNLSINSPWGQYLTIVDFTVQLYHANIWEEEDFRPTVYCSLQHHQCRPRQNVSYWNDASLRTHCTHSLWHTPTHTQPDLGGANK